MSPSLGVKALYKQNIISKIYLQLTYDLGNEQLIKTKEEIQKKYELFYNKWRDYDLLTSIMSILGLVVAIIDVINSQ